MESSGVREVGVGKAAKGELAGLQESACRNERIEKMEPMQK